MTKTTPITAGLLGCLFLVSCEPIPVGPQPRNRPSERYDRPEPRPYGEPGDPYGGQGELPPAPQPAPQPTRDQYPTAERTANPNQVLSPYAPYNVIDVEGFRTGQLAKDPSNGKIFRIP
jgi:hypothetical protein